MARVVVADDSLLHRTLMADTLERAGHDVVATAASGEEALRTVAQHRPDVLVMDLVMPDMQGLELLDAMRSRRVACPCILVSGNVDERHAREAEGLRLVAVLAKPVDEARLLSAVLEAAPDRPPREPSPVLDPTAFGRLREQMDGSFAGFVDLFVREGGQRAVSLRAAADDRDAVRLGREAHTLRPTCSMLGASSLALRLGHLETACRGGWSDDALWMADAVASDLTILLQRLEPVIHERPSP